MRKLEERKDVGRALSQDEQEPLLLNPVRRRKSEDPCYSGRVSNLRKCLVTFTDLHGIEHRSECSAASLFEAVAVAMRTFREEEWSAPAVWEIGYFDVSVMAPAVSHRVLLKSFHNFMERSNGSPREVVLRQRLKQILGE